MEKPTEYNADMRLSIEPEIISGNDVLTLKDVSKSFGNKSLFHGLSADIFREERVALIGPNGTGKTTLLKIICKKISNNGLVRSALELEFPLDTMTRHKIT